MTPLNDRLRELLLSGVELSLEDGKPKVRAAEGVLSPAALETLRRHKDEIARVLPELRFDAPLSVGQEGLWIIQKNAPESAAYNVGLALLIESDSDPAPTLRRALQKLVNRHPLLRTTYSEVDGRPRQVVRGYQDFTLQEFDISHLSWAEALRHIAAAQQLPFNLEAEGGCRFQLFRRGGRESILLFCVHHIAVDGWSFRRLIDELLRLYAADGQPNPLAPVRHTYHEFVRLQRDTLESRGEELRRAWMDELKGAPLVLNLPVDRPRPPVQTFHGATLLQTLDPSLVRDLRGLARAQETTLYTLFLAAYQVLLHRYCGQDDFCVGTTAAVRDRAELAETLGYMVNILPLRTQLSGAEPPDFVSFLHTTRATVLRALERQAYPFPRLVQDVLNHRDPARPPVVQALFSYQRAQLLSDASVDLFAGRTVPLAGGQLRLVPLPQQISEVEFTLEVSEHAEHIELGFRYNSDLFEAPTIERMAGHFTSLLRSIVADPRRRVSQLQMITQREREQLLVDWNQTQTPFSHQACIHELFEAQVDRSPDAVALVDLCGQPAGSRGIPMTYRELDRRANQVAHRLRRLGVGPDTLVGLCMERSASLIVGLLGILKAGGAYVVLDLEHPRKRLAFLLEDTQVPVVLTQGVLRARLPDLQAQVVDFDQGFQGESEERPASGVGPENLAYVLYTSGSTGEPNGAMVEHRGLCNVVEVTLPVMDIGPGARLAHSTSFNFDGATGPLFWMLVSGGTVYLAPREGDALGRGLVELIEREQLTHIFLVPSMLAALPAAELPTLKAISLGGERVSPELVKRWGQGGRIRNMYGPTEVTIFATAARCWPDGSVPTIGRPIGNIQAYILDRHGELSPPGVPGELYLAGVGVGRGYLRRPELTAQKYLNNLFGPGRMYRTGDIVKYRIQGDAPPEIEFLGRSDNQIKLRGHRIELGEIERALRASPQVRDAVVMVQGASAGDASACIVAYVTPADPQRAADKELGGSLRQELADALPLHMIPAAIVVLPEFPLNINGKLDVRALPQPATPSNGAAKEDPQTETERTIADLWSQLLGVKQVSVHDNFFFLGGHSLLAAQIIARLSAALGIEIQAQSILKMPTIRELASHVDAIRAARRLAKDRQQAGTARRERGRL